MVDRPPAGGQRPVVAITRSADDNRSLATALEARGFEVVVVALVEVTEAADGGRALSAALAELANYDWVVLTSVNGVRSVLDARAGRPWPEGVGVAAVGPTTAATARAAGLQVELVPETATAAALVEAFPPAQPGRPGRVLAPLAELASDTVIDGLTAKGWLVDRVEAYRTVPPADRRHAVADVDVDADARADGAPAHHIDAVAFFSPSAVDRWVDRFGARAPLAVCIGPATAARAGERGLPRVVTASPHSTDGVVTALVESLTGSASRRLSR